MLASAPTCVQSFAMHPHVRPRCGVRLAAASQSVSESEGLRLLYDGNCMVCLTNKAVLSAFDRKKRLAFVNVASPSYNPADNGFIQLEDAMRHIHVFRPPNEVIEGADAVMAAYTAVGLGWLMRILKLPIARAVVNAAYAFVSRHRMTLSRLIGGKWMANAITSLYHTAEGEGCEDEEECVLPYDDDEDDE